MANLTGYFDAPQIQDRRAYISRNKIAIALKGLEFFFTNYGEGIRSEETEQMREGRKLHQAVLEPELWRRNKQVYRFASTRAPGYSEWSMRVMREYPGSNIMSLQESLRYERIVDRVMSHRLAGDLIRRALRERHGYGVCPRTGAQLYSRPDLKTPEGWLGELKFVRSIDAFEFGRQQHREKWFMQLAFYNFVDSLITGTRLKGNCFYIAVEHFYPHRIAVLTLSPDFEAMGDALWNEGLDKILACLKVDPEIKNFEIWRALSNQANELTPEPWMLDRSASLKNLIGTIGG